MPRKRRFKKVHKVKHYARYAGSKAFRKVKRKKDLPEAIEQAEAVYEVPREMKLVDVRRQVQLGVLQPKWYLGKRRITNDVIALKSRCNAAEDHNVILQHKLIELRKQTAELEEKLKKMEEGDGTMVPISAASGVIEKRLKNLIYKYDAVRNELTNQSKSKLGKLTKAKLIALLLNARDKLSITFTKAKEVTGNGRDQKHAN